MSAPRESPPDDPLIPWALADDGPIRAMRSDSKRNRESVVDALLALHRDGNLQPNSTEVAERAGISARSLFRYFVDIDDLGRAAITRLLDQMRPLLAIDAAADAPVAERISALVSSRTRLFEAMGPTGVVARLRSPFQPVIAAQLTQARKFFRQQIQQLFAAELAAMDDADAVPVVAAIDVLCSFESYQLLRGDHGLTEDGAARSLRRSLARLLGAS